MKPNPSIESDHPPLARDALGNLRPIPAGTAAWRVCRHTGGRPRIVVGADRQPARFPLELTGEELLDMCGSDTYRLYAIDEVGDVLDYVTTIELPREPRNANISLSSGHSMPARLDPAVATAGSSDLRFALEMVAQIARTNGEALRAVAESQASRPSRWRRASAERVGATAIAAAA